MSSINLIPSRVVIYPKDVQNITGRKDRSARELLQKIKMALGKPKHQLISIQEFCLYTGMNEELVRSFLD